MKIFTYEEPFPHIRIENIFEPEEYKAVWNELIFLVPKMKLPTETNAATKERGLPKKRGYGIMIDSMFTDQENSDILLYAKKTVCEEVRNASGRMSLYFRLFKHVSHGSTLVQIYRNGDYYESHEDSSAFTAVTLIHKTPKKYDGGDLWFPEYKFIPKLENNCTVIFPSVIIHEVTELKNKSSKIEDARYTISQLLSV